MVSRSSEVCLRHPYLSFPVDSGQLEAKGLFFGHLSRPRTYPGPGAGKPVLKGRENCDQSIPISPGAAETS